MRRGGYIQISGAVEGVTDETVLARLFEHVGAKVGVIHNARGKSNLIKKLNAYNNAGKTSPWTVIIDLDKDHDCAPELISALQISPSPYLIVRAAVRSIESWLLADREHFASFFKVPLHHLPNNPDALIYPKQELVNLVRKSKSGDIRRDVVPTASSGRSVGPAYPSQLISFTLDRSGGWRPHVAAARSDSLNRCIHALRGLLQKTRIDKY